MGRIAGWFVVAVGVMLAAASALRDVPWQAGVALGVMLAIAGGLVICEAEERRS